MYFRQIGSVPRERDTLHIFRDFLHYIFAYSESKKSRPLIRSSRYGKASSQSQTCKIALHNFCVKKNISFQRLNVLNFRIRAASAINAKTC